MTERGPFLGAAAVAVLALLLPGAAAALGAPVALECAAVNLTAPAAGDNLTGAIEIQGSARVINFSFYKVEYSSMAQDDWVLIGPDVVTQPVDRGRLVVWQTTLVPDGTYRLRLRVVDFTGNYCQVVVSPVVVSNAAPSTEEPAPTETPLLTVVPPQPSPTRPPVLTGEFSPTEGAPSALPTRSLFSGMAGFDLSLLGAFFLFGVLVMLSVAIFVGAFMIIRKWSG